MIVTIYLDDEPVGKVLDKKSATSIMIAKEVLEASDSLEKVAVNRDNEYFCVKGTNTVIMHVEDDFCILVDNNINGINVPKELAKEHYAVYQQSNRDWVRNSATSTNIGYDIKNIIYGPNARPQGYTLDHLAETFDERDKNKVFTDKNFNNGSHRVCVKIVSEGGLAELIKKIRQDCLNKNKGGIFLK